MNEAQTRKDLIDPAIEKAGWTKANGCQVLVEQSAVEFAPGKVGKVKGKPLAADYVLTYRGRRLVVIEAKRDEVDASLGFDQALDERGILTDRRKVQPTEWHELYLKNRPEQSAVTVYDVPETQQKQPGVMGQFCIQLKRIFATKKTNTQYLLITLLVSPLLALICGLLTRYAPETGYTLMENKNFVTFMFMAVIASIFMMADRLESFIIISSIIILGLSIIFISSNNVLFFPSTHDMHHRIVYPDIPIKDECGNVVE